MGESLPVFQYKQEILDKLQRYQLLVVSGETGCGKTTQIPQFITEVFPQQRILITQPRRVSATSIARRLAAERGYQNLESSDVGFQISGHKSFDWKNDANPVMIVVVTTGILLNWLCSVNGGQILDTFSFFIIDEAHERSSEADLCLAQLRRKLLFSSSSFRLIIMSATINIDIFLQYFHPLQGEKVVISQRKHELHKHYLDNLPLEGFSPEERKMLTDTRMPSNGMSAGLLRALVQIVKHIHLNKPTEHGILIFVSGIAMINEISDEINYALSRFRRPHYRLYPLHSSFEIFEQLRALAPEKNCRKIVIATSIAESSITIPDIHFVVDTCMVKQMVYDPIKKLFSLSNTEAPKSVLDQRAGRAGRVSKGYVYRLITHKDFMYRPDFPTPEIQRLPLENIILMISPEVVDSADLLRECIDPPTEAQISMAFEKLAKLHLVGEDGRITILGRIIASMGMAIEPACVIYFGWSLAILREALIAAAVLVHKSPILAPVSNLPTAYLQRIRYLGDTHPSDVIASIRAFLYWKENCPADPTLEKQWCMQNFLSLYWLREIDSTILTLQQKLRAINFGLTMSKEEYERLNFYRKRSSDPRDDSAADEQAALYNNLNQIAQTPYQNTGYGSNSSSSSSGSSTSGSSSSSGNSFGFGNTAYFQGGGSDIEVDDEFGEQLDEFLEFPNLNWDPIVIHGTTKENLRLCSFVVGGVYAHNQCSMTPSFSNIGPKSIHKLKDPFSAEVVHSLSFTLDRPMDPFIPEKVTARLEKLLGIPGCVVKMHLPRVAPSLYKKILAVQFKNPPELPKSVQVLLGNSLFLGPTRQMNLPAAVILSTKLCRCTLGRDSKNRDIKILMVTTHEDCTAQLHPPFQTPGRVNITVDNFSLLHPGFFAEGVPRGHLIPANIQASNPNPKELKLRISEVTYEPLETFRKLFHVFVRPAIVDVQLDEIRHMLYEILPKRLSEEEVPEEGRRPLAAVILSHIYP